MKFSIFLHSHFCLVRGLFTPNVSLNLRVTRYLLNQKFHIVSCKCNEKDYYIFLLTLQSHYIHLMEEKKKKSWIPLILMIKKYCGKYFFTDPVKSTCIKSLLSLGLFHVRSTAWKVQIAFINKSLLQRVYSGLQAHHQYCWRSHQAPAAIFRGSSYNSKTNHTQFSPCEHQARSVLPLQTQSFLSTQLSSWDLKKNFSNHFQQVHIFQHI